MPRVGVHGCAQLRIGSGWTTQGESTTARDEVIPDAPLYDPAFEHDACGVGFVAESRRGPSRRVVPLALAALAAMAHRGALGADARTSDGSGLALPLGPELLERLTAGAWADRGWSRSASPSEWSSCRRLPPPVARPPA